MNVPGKRDLRTLWDLDAQEIADLLTRAEELRFLRSLREPHATRPGRVLGMIFEKASTRTRVSFDVAIFELGGHGVVLGRNDSQLGRGEPLPDTARVLSGYCHALLVRTFGQEKIEALAKHATIPVINGLSDLSHPCQVLADLETVFAEFSELRPAAGGAAADVAAILRSVRYAWIGDGNNMANSWIEAAAVLGLDLMLACPQGYDPDPDTLAKAAATGRGRITVTRDPREAVAGRQVVSTDVFTSMGQEKETEVRLRAFSGYCVDVPLMAQADKDAIVLHCLPAHRGEEIAHEVIEGPQSRVWKQAENRLHAQKALLEWVLA